MNKPYHNKGFFPAFIAIVLGFFVLPVVLMMMMDDTVERFTKKYGITRIPIPLYKYFIHGSNMTMNHNKIFNNLKVKK